MQRITIGTFGEILEHGHGLDCWCPGCRRWAAVNVAELVAAGLGDRVPGRCRPRCRICGGLGQWQLRPPVPTLDPARPYGGSGAAQRDETR